MRAQVGGALQNLADDFPLLLGAKVRAYLCFARLRLVLLRLSGHVSWLFKSVKVWHNDILLEGQQERRVHMFAVRW